MVSVFVGQIFSGGVVNIERCSDEGDRYTLVSNDVAFAHELERGDNGQVVDDVGFHPGIVVAQTGIGRTRPWRTGVFWLGILVVHVQGEFEGVHTRFHGKHHASSAGGRCSSGVAQRLVHVGHACTFNAFVDDAVSHDGSVLLNRVGDVPTVVLHRVASSVHDFSIHEATTDVEVGDFAFLGERSAKACAVRVVSLEDAHARDADVVVGDPWSQRFRRRRFSVGRRL